MNIIQITPAGRAARSGNRSTAERWARIWQGLGHRVTTASQYEDQAAQLMVALHARYSHPHVMRFRELYPGRPLVVALTGTDINQDIHTHPGPVRETMAAADALVCFHDRVRDIMPARLCDKLRVIHQSALALPGGRNPARRRFEVCVVGNLRRVKDPLRAAYAVRDLPRHSRIRVTHLGRAIEEDLRLRALREMAGNPRFRWLGEVPGWRVRREFARTRLMVISSRAEGGANVLSEAIVAGVPVAASEINGNVGLLGRDYSGYYPAGDTRALRKLLLRSEAEPEFLARLIRQCAVRSHLFSPHRERESWGELIDSLV